MNILFTLIVFKRFTGSELVTLDQVEYFVKNGHNVDIFTLESGTPLIDHLPSCVNIIMPSNESELSTHYDLIISRQWPLLEYILFSKKIAVDKVYFEAISWRLPIDYFPYFYKSLTLCGYVSKRIKKKLESIGYDTKDSIYFPNYSKSDFFDYNYIIRNPNTPKRIAFVSNHAPQELEQAAAVLKKDGNIECTFFGMNHTQVLITPKVLSEYDLVVSIGKTVFFAISMGVPCYLYDETCSIGYITPDNYQRCLEGNMAGSENKQNKDPNIIAEELLSGYPTAAENSSQLKEYARRDFFFDDLMNKLLEDLDRRPPMNLEKMRKEYHLAESLSPVYINEAYQDRKEILRWYEESLRLGSLVQEVREEYRKLDAYKDVLIADLKKISDKYNRTISARIKRLLKTLWSALKK